MLRTALETTTMIIVRTKSFWVVNIPLYCYWWMKNNQYVLDFQQECQDTAEVILLCWALLLCFGLKFPLVAVWKKKCWVGKRQHFKMLKRHLTSSMSNYIIITNLKKRGISPLVHSLLEPLFFSFTTADKCYFHIYRQVSSFSLLMMDKKASFCPKMLVLKAYISFMILSQQTHSYYFKVDIASIRWKWMKSEFT